MGCSLVLSAILIALTHGFRMLGRLAGPRWGGLVLGLPCTSALILVGSGIERGAGYAVGMAESSLLGVVAGVALPLTYALAVGWEWRWPLALIVAVTGYLVVACAVHCLEVDDSGLRLGLVTGSVLLGWSLADRFRIAPDPQRRGEPSRSRVLMLRTLVPVCFLGTIMALRDAVGAEWAGLLSTFPGLTLALLVVTHQEAGPAEVARLARSLPPGSLCLIAFLTTFRLGCPELGLALGTTCGYAAALAALVLVERLTRRADPDGYDDETAARRPIDRPVGVGARLGSRLPGRGRLSETGLRWFTPEFEVIT